MAFFLARRVNQLSSVEQQVLAQIQQASPLIAAGHALFHQFRDLLTSRVADKLSAWIQAARTSGLPEMENFAFGLERDLEAIQNAASLTWSNGSNGSACQPAENAQAPDVRTCRFLICYAVEFSMPNG